MNVLADYAWRQANRCLIRSDAAPLWRTRLYWRYRSRWWTDLQCWMDGLVEFPVRPARTAWMPVLAGVNA